MSNVTVTKGKARQLAEKGLKDRMIEIPGDSDASARDVDGTQVIEGSGNILADLGLPNPGELYLKAAVANRLEDLIEAADLTQAPAALRMGISQPDVSNIVRGRLKGYTLDRLIECLIAMGQRVELRLPRNRIASGRGRLIVSCENEIDGQ